MNFPASLFHSEREKSERSKSGIVISLLETKRAAHIKRMLKGMGSCLIILLLTVMISEVIEQSHVSRFFSVHWINLTTCLENNKFLVDLLSNVALFSLVPTNFGFMKRKIFPKWWMLKPSRKLSWWFHEFPEVRLMHPLTIFRFDFFFVYDISSTIATVWIIFIRFFSTSRFVSALLLN